VDLVFTLSILAHFKNLIFGLYAVLSKNYNRPERQIVQALKWQKIVGFYRPIGN